MNARGRFAPSPVAKNVRDALLGWYDEVGRDLPWRRTRDPYAIWVSEVMCQQTRVDTVVPYYDRFMERFPTAAALAEAPEDDVMALWSGLGYYRRARMLHTGVREVVAKYGGEVPEGAEERRTLPGVGRYTAGAIGSIAFHREEPVVDGNVARVLSRLHGIDTPLGQAATEQRLWTEAGKLVRGPRPGDLNQAVMELGATVCTPTSPKCDACPIASACVAHGDGRQASLPVRRQRKPPRGVELVAVVPLARGGDRVWMARGGDALFGGLWSLPSVEGTERAAARHALAAHAIVARVARDAAGTVEHVLSHRRLEVRVFRATAARAHPTDALRLLAPHDLGSVGVSRLTKKVLALAWSLSP